MKNQISFIEVVKSIEAMRENYETDKINTSIIDINYLRFKKIMSKVKKDEYISLKNQVINLRKLDYNTLTNIRNTNPVIARKCERMYQIETLLNKYCKFKILDISYDNNDYIYRDEFEKNDLSKYKVDWNDFCDSIQQLNEDEIITENEYWQKHKDYYRNIKLTTLGLDEMVLSGTPNALKDI